MAKQFKAVLIGQAMIAKNGLLRITRYLEQGCQGGAPLISEQKSPSLVVLFNHTSFKFMFAMFKRGFDLKKLVLLLLITGFPLMTLSQEETPKNYISFGIGTSAFPGKFGMDDPLYQGSTSMGMGYQLNGAYYLENIGFGVKTGTYLQRVKKPSAVEINNTEFKGDQYSGAWTSAVYLIGPHYAIRKEKFQWDARLYMGSLRAEGPELEWWNSDDGALKTQYDSWNRFALNLGVSGSYDLTNIISAGLAIDYIHSRPAKASASVEHPYNEDDVKVQPYQQFDQSMRLLNVMASLRFNIYHNECDGE